MNVKEEFLQQDVVTKSTRRGKQGWSKFANNFSSATQYAEKKRIIIISSLCGCV